MPKARARQTEAGPRHVPPQNCLMSTAKCRWRAFGDTGQLPPQPALAHQKRSVTRRGLSLDEVRTRSTLLLRLRSGPREPCFSHSPRLCPVRGCAGNKQHKETQIQHKVTHIYNPQKHTKNHTQTTRRNTQRHHKETHKYNAQKHSHTIKYTHKDNT